MVEKTFPALPDSLTDFNDLSAAAGLDSVREQIAEAVPAVTPPAPPQWPDPILPGQRRVPDIPASVLPDWLGAMAHAVSESTQTPPALAVMSSLAVLATVLQRRFEVAPYGDSYTEPLALWTLSATPSGTRKSAVLNAMLGPLVPQRVHMRVFTTAQQAHGHNVTKIGRIGRAAMR